MKCRDIEKYFEENLGVEKESYSSLSSGLIKSEVCQAYSFDKIVKIFFSKNQPKSADAILIQRKSDSKRAKIFLIEFKRGFDEDTMCKETQTVCERMKEKINSELTDKLFLKAIESRWVLEFHVSPDCNDNSEGDDYYYSINYLVVINAPVDEIEYNRMELAKRSQSENNIWKIIRESLSRLGERSNFDRVAYYDTVSPPMNPKTFSEYLT